MITFPYRYVRDAFSFHDVFTNIKFDEGVYTEEEVSETDSDTESTLSELSDYSENELNPTPTTSPRASPNLSQQKEDLIKNVN